MMALVPTRNLALELVRTTEAAAMAAGRFMGRGDKEGADQAAVNAMRLILNSVEMDGIVRIGEGEKDSAPMLYNGEKLGTGVPPEVDIAVDPVDGTGTLSKGMLNSVSVVALAPRGSMFDPGPFVYMYKIAVGPEAKHVIDINAPVKANLAWIAKARGEQIQDLTVMILDRPRHEELIAEVRQTGARIRLIPDGDVIGSLMTTLPESGIDVMLGIGGSPEAIITACALRAAGGNMQAKLYPRTDEERKAGEKLGYDIGRTLSIEDLVSSDDTFFSATGVTRGELLSGVDYFADGAHTDSLVLRGLTGTMRRIRATHRLDKLDRISMIEY